MQNTFFSHLILWYFLSQEIKLVEDQVNGDMCVVDLHAVYQFK